jgi:hypothetical protein
MLLAIVGLFVSLLASGTAYYQVYQPASQDHQIGHVYNATEWQVTVADPEGAYMTYGPYATDAPLKTDLLITFTLAVDNNNADDLEILTLDVHDTASNRVLTNWTLHRNDFEAAGTPQNFQLFFTTPSAAARLEYRVYYVCCSEVTHVLTTVQSLNDTGPITAFWSDGAHWNYTSKAQFSSPYGSPGMNVGFMFVTQPGMWYCFHREYGFQPSQPSYCKADFARLVVRTSTDKGRTWSNGTVMASPVEGTPYECALVDGGAFFDQAGGRWLYLSQCLDRTDTWAMCLFIRNSLDPVGPFQPFTTQPTVAGGQLWSQICAGPNKHCLPSMAEEGTPEIVMRDAEGYYYVTFHGYRIVSPLFCLAHQYDVVFSP